MHRAFIAKIMFSIKAGKEINKTLTKVICNFLSIIPVVVGVVVVAVVVVVVVDFAVVVVDFVVAVVDFVVAVVDFVVVIVVLVVGFPSVGTGEPVGHSDGLNVNDGVVPLNSK